MPIWNALKMWKCPLGWNFFGKQRRFLSVKYLRKTFHHTGFRKIRKIFRSSFFDVDILQWRVQNPVKHLRWSVLQKWLIAKIRYIFSQNAPFLMFGRVLDTPIYFMAIWWRKIWIIENNNNILLEVKKMMATVILGEF